MADLLLDTDVLIDHLAGKRKVSARWAGSAYSSLTRAELYAGRYADETAIDRLLAIFGEIPLDCPIAEEAGRIRRNTATGIADAVIAASAIVSGRELVTRNVRHFSGIRGLVLHPR